MPSQPNPTLIGSGSDACVGTWSCDFLCFWRLIMQSEKMIYSKSDSTLIFMGKSIMQPVQTNNHVRTLLVVATQKNIFFKNNKKLKVK